MEYRKADLSDVETVSIMRAEMLREEGDYPEQSIALLLENTKRYVKAGIEDGSFITWLAKEDNEAAAMGGACFFTLPPNGWCPDGKTAYICNIYTRPSFRGRGAASRVIGLIVDEAMERGCERIWLHAGDEVKPLYEKYGFKMLDTAMGLYPFGTAPRV